jgi:hypothetical protein
MLQSAEVVAAVNLSEQSSIIINLIPSSCFAHTHEKEAQEQLHGLLKNTTGMVP